MIPESVADAVERSGLRCVYAHRHGRRWLALILEADATEGPCAVGDRAMRLLRSLRSSGWPTTWLEMVAHPMTGAPLARLRFLPWRVAS